MWIASPQKFLAAFPERIWADFPFRFVDAGAAGPVQTRWLELRPWLWILACEPIPEALPEAVPGVERQPVGLPCGR